jgi:hypothetical protein
VRKALLSVIVSATAVSATVLIGVAPAGAASPVELSLPQGTAFSILGYSCGGIQEQAYATGFDPTSGYPTGAVYLQTSCGGSGRGGGYHSTTYTAWAGVTWDFTGTVVSSAELTAAPTVDPAFSAYDQNGNEVYNQSSNAYLLLAPTFTPLPRVTGISPSSGSALGGTSVAVTGTGFTGATAVSFGGVGAASYTVNSDTSITAVAPADSAGVTDLTVTTAGGSNQPGPADEFTFIAVPSVTQISPRKGPVTGGTVVTITGSGFTDANEVMFGETGTSFTVNSDTSITALAPANEGPDTSPVRVVSPGGTSTASGLDQFTYVAAPTITNFTPRSGGPGTAVVISGTHLSGATTVTFAGKAAVMTSDSGTKITAKVPAGAKSGRVRVTTAGGTATSPVAFTVT